MSYIHIIHALYFKGIDIDLVFPNSSLTDARFFVRTRLDGDSSQLGTSPTNITYFKFTIFQVESQSKCIVFAEGFNFLAFTGLAVSREM